MIRSGRAATLEIYLGNNRAELTSLVAILLLMFHFMRLYLILYYVLFNCLKSSPFFSKFVKYEGQTKLSEANTQLFKSTLSFKGITHVASHVVID